MKFEWDENKNISNKKKHNINFNNEKEIFNDSDRVETQDLRKDYKEKRYIIIGRVLSALLVVVYTIRKNTIRIISARRANKKERDSYNTQKK